jgi:hypothetical protein
MAGCRRCPSLFVFALVCMLFAAEARADAPTPPYRLSLSGLVQVDGMLYHQASVDELDPASREPLNLERIVLSRAWLGAVATYEYAHGAVTLEGTTTRGPQVRLLAAELGVAYPGNDSAPLVDLTAGLFLIPFGLETREPVPSRMFLEASAWVDALFPGRRDLGLRLSGSVRFLRYDLAVMNGNPIGGASLPLRDPNRAKDVLGRIGVDDALTSWLHVVAGISALVGRGFDPGVAPTKDTFAVRDVNEDGIAQPSEIQIVAGDPGEPSHGFDHRALGGDVRLDYELPVLGDGRLYGEVAWAVNLDRALFVADPRATGRDARELGMMVALRQKITRHAEIGMRYDRYDPDRDANSRRGVRTVPFDASFSTLAAAVSWCTLGYLRMSLQYDHRQNPLGRDLRGAPTTLAADSLTLRGQLEL